jgi:cell division protein FtsL
MTLANLKMDWLIHHLQEDEMNRERIAKVRTLTQAYSQVPWRKQIQVIGLFLLALVFSAVVSGIYLSVTARAATVGREIQYLQGEIEKNKQVNLDMQSQLAQLTSSAVMESRAVAMGFEPVEKDQPLFIVVPGYQGRQQIVLAPPPGPVKAGAPTLPPDFSESLVDWLQQRVLPILGR